MKSSTIIIKFTFIMFAAFTLSSCGSLKENVAKELKTAQIAPDYPPNRNITNFAESLRCMDDLMLTHGIEKISVLAEDLVDSTKKVNAGTRDMLITAVSDMTKRSRAINLIVFGNDSGNLISFLAQSGKQSVYNNVPKYDIRGSITQLDRDVISKQMDAGISLVEFGFGVATSAAGTILGLDLSVVDTSDMSLIPGVTSRNSIMIFQTGKGGDADATIKKVGINFGINFGKNEGTAQALRNLVELATIELFGKLLKLPYWACLKADPSQKIIQQEIGDWYFSLKRANELTAFVQMQLAKRGYYAGEVDGRITPDFEKSVALYKLSKKLPNDANIDGKFFDVLLNTPMPESAKTKTVVVKSNVAEDVAQIAVTAEQQQVEQQAQTSAQAEPQPLAQAQPAASGQGPSDAAATSYANEIVIQNRSAHAIFSPGERLNLAITAGREAYLYCFYQDDQQQIQRVFPNRFRSNNLITNNEIVYFPGSMPFEITASKSGGVERLGCFSTQNDILNDLAAEIKVLDFVKLDVSSMNDIRSSIQKLAGPSLGEGYFEVKTQ